MRPKELIFKLMSNLGYILVTPDFFKWPKKVSSVAMSENIN